MTPRKELDHDCPEEVRDLLLMHDETNATEHREHTRLLREIKWEYVQLMHELQAERASKAATISHLSKGVLTWATIAILSILSGGLLFALKGWLVKVVS